MPHPEGRATSRWLTDALPLLAQRLDQAPHCVLGVDYDSILALVLKDPTETRLPEH